MAAIAGQAVSVHHATIGQGVYLEAQGQWSAWAWPQLPGAQALGASQAFMGGWGGPGLDSCGVGKALSQTGSRLWAMGQGEQLRRGCSALGRLQGGGGLSWQVQPPPLQDSRSSQQPPLVGLRTH